MESYVASDARRLERDDSRNDIGNTTRQYDKATGTRNARRRVSLPARHCHCRRQRCRAQRVRRARGAALEEQRDEAEAEGDDEAAEDLTERMAESHYELVARKGKRDGGRDGGAHPGGGGRWRSRWRCAPWTKNGDITG
jgi:hypothetical protein